MDSYEVELSYVIKLTARVNDGNDEIDAIKKAKTYIEEGLEIKLNNKNIKKENLRFDSVTYIQNIKK